MEACKLMYRSGKVVYYNHIPGSKRKRYLSEGNISIDNILFVPLGSNGKVIGSLILTNKPGGFTEDDVKIASAFGKLASIYLYSSQILEFTERDEENFRAVVETATVENALYKHKMRSLLKESEEKYRSMAENAHDAIYITTPEGLQYANPAFEKITGYKREELYNEEFNFLNIIHPDDRELIKDKAKKRGKERPNSNEFRIISKDRGVKTVEANRVNLGKKGEVKEMVILRDITVHKKLEQKLKKSYKRLQKIFKETVNALVSALEKRDSYTAGHQKRVASLACAIAEEMGLPKKQIEGIRMAGIIHDIGKIQIPTEILIKAEHLSDIEFVMIKTHPQVGYDILKEIEFPHPVAQITLQHHERMDGSGYPAGLSGEEILLEARILAVADAVEAMSSHRPYRPALGIDTALEESTKDKGILYDSEVADACIKLFKKKGFKFE